MLCHNVACCVAVLFKFLACLSCFVPEVSVYVGLISYYMTCVMNLVSMAPCVYKCCCCRRFCRSHSEMLVFLISNFVFGVIGVVVVVVWLLSLPMVYSYLLVKSMFCFKQIQVCNVGSEFVHRWMLCLLGVGHVTLDSSDSVWRFMLSMTLIIVFKFVCVFIVCYSVAWVVIMLYESPRQ